MASSKIKGITVEIGGDTTKLGKAIGDIEKQSNSLKGELKQVEKLLKMDPGNADLLAQKQEILTRAVSETTEKLKILRDAQEQVEKQFKDGKIGEDKYRAFQREIIKTENELKDFQNTLDDTGDDFEDMGESAEESSEGFTIMKGALADLVANAISSAISAIGDFIGSIMELSEATEEYRTMQAKLEGSSKTFGYSVDFAKSKYEEFYKYLGDDQASTNAITNLMGIGAETETVSKLADGATAVWASYGDSIPIEGLTEAINETITVGKVTGGMADTINWAKNANEGLNTALSGNKEAQKAFNDAIKEGLPTEDAFNEALAKITDEQERADVVANFLNETYGESKKAYDEVAGSVIDANEAELELKDTQAQLGETVAPVNNALTEMKNQALQSITPLVESLANGFMKLYEWLEKNPTVAKILTGVVIALATAFTVLAGALAIQGIITGVTKAIAFLNTTLLANPIVLIVGAIAGLVAGFIYLWNNCEAFRNFWVGLWEKIKTAFSNFIAWISPAIESIKVFFVSLWEKIKEIWTSIMASLQPLFDTIIGAFKEGWEMIKVIWDLVKPYFHEIWNGIQVIFSVVKEILGAYFENAWLTIKLIWSVAVSYFKTIWANIKAVFSVVKTFFSGMFKSAWEAIKAVWNGVIGYFTAIWNTIKGIFSVVKNVLSGNWKDAWEAIKGIVSTWTSYFSGVWSSIKKVFGSVKSWFSSTFSSAWTAVKNVFSNWGSFFSGLWSKIKNTFSNIGTNIASAISGAVKSGINGVISMIQNTINKGIGLINGAIGVINKVPGVSIKKINTLSLPRLARGGIVDSPTIAEIGEDGREAIIPLEKNTQWLRNVANELNQNLIGEKANGELLSRLDSIYERLDRMQVVLDTGVIVGETVDAYDRAFASRKTQLARGW